MFNQKLQATENIEFEIAEELRYETDPCELKLDEMIEAEPEPEMIEGLPASDALTPADRYLELFEHVQSTRLFADSKTFPDCAPKMDPLDILIRYRKVRRHRDFDLRQFVENHFWMPETYGTEYVSDPGLSLKEHIDNLWPVLTREPQDHIPWSSLLALPQAYIVPGGRFSETYYWDSYFSMLGLAESGRNDLLKCMADNFAWLIERYGHIPNGNRTYYLSRSQPPVFALMVELFEEDGVRGAKRYLDHLKMEYAFWMDGAESLLLNQAYRSAVRMSDGSLLNRYWDDRDTPCGVRLGLLVPLAARSVAARQHPHDAVYPHRSERLPVQAGKRYRQHLGVERGQRDGRPVPPESQRSPRGGEPLFVGRGERLLPRLRLATRRAGAVFCRQHCAAVCRHGDP